MPRSLLAAGILLGGLGCLGARPTTVRLTNADSLTLDSVIVHVTGRSYLLGRLTPGETRDVQVDPTSESHVELTQTGGPRLMIGTYFERGYGATVTAHIRRDTVLTVETTY